LAWLSVMFDVCVGL